MYSRHWEFSYLMILKWFYAWHFFEENGEGEQMKQSKGPIVTMSKGGA